MELHTIPPDIVYKIVLIGDSHVGKSSILSRYTTDTFNNTFTHTIGVDFFIKNIHHSNKNIKIQLWDTAGQEQYAKLIRSYFTNCTAAIIVYDITNRQSFKNVSFWLKTFSMDYKEDRPVILVGNKIDNEKKREVTTDEGQELALNLDIEFIECSSKDNININEIFTILTSKLLFLIDNENFSPTPLNGLKLYPLPEEDNAFTKKCCVIC